MEEKLGDKLPQMSLYPFSTSVNGKSKKRSCLLNQISINQSSFSDLHYTRNFDKDRFL